MRHNEYRSWYVRGVLKLSFHLSRLWVFVLLCLLEFFGVFLFFSPLYRCRVYHFFWWSCVYQTEISPFSLGKGRLRLRFWEPCTKLSPCCWWLKGAVSLSSALCFCVVFFDAAVLPKGGKKKTKPPYILFMAAVHTQISWKHCEISACVKLWLPP